MNAEHMVIIDMQQDFLMGKPEKTVTNATKVISRLIDDSRRQSRPITCVFHAAYGPTIPEISSQLEPKELVAKCFDDAFTSLAFVQRVTGYDLLYVTGCNLEFCVLDTVRSALARQISVVAYRNAILSRHIDSELKSQTELWLATAARCLYMDFYG